MAPERFRMSAGIQNRIVLGLIKSFIPLEIWGWPLRPIIRSERRNQIVHSRLENKIKLGFMEMENY